MQHFQKLISTFHKDYPEKSIVTSTPVDKVHPWPGQPSDLRLRPPNKSVADQPKPTTLSTLKRAESSNFYLVFSPVSSKSKKSFFVM